MIHSQLAFILPHIKYNTVASLLMPHGVVVNCTGTLTPWTTSKTKCPEASWLKHKEHNFVQTHIATEQHCTEISAFFS